MDREPSETVLFDGHPSWLSTPGLYVKGLLTALIAGVAAGLISALVVGGRVHGLWVALAVAVVFLRVGIKSYMRWARTTYTITDRRVTVRVGLVSRDVRETRLDHVLNVKSRQTLLERLLGIGTVHFDTVESGFAFRGVAEPRDLARRIARVVQER